MKLDLEQMKTSLILQTRKNDVVANNLANVQTIGFKRDLVFFKVLSNKMQEPPELIVKPDFSQGPLQQTGNPLDLAFSGPGFFAVETDSGEAYTRNGHFRLGADGTLLTSDGLPVLGEGGRIVLQGKENTPESIVITEKGEIYVDDEFMDRLKIVDFENYDQLQKAGSNLFILSGEATPIAPSNSAIRQGFLEKSNVDPVREMIGLVEVQRRFENTQRMVRAVDELLNYAVNKLGKY